VAAWTIDRFTDGKIAESRIIMDTLAMMQQLGVIPPPGAPPP
jgi:predicted ester cyclase